MHIWLAATSVGGIVLVTGLKPLSAAAAKIVKYHKKEMTAKQLSADAVEIERIKADVQVKLLQLEAEARAGENRARSRDRRFLVERLEGLVRACDEASRPGQAAALSIVLEAAGLTACTESSSKSELPDVG